MRDFHGTGLAVDCSITGCLLDGLGLHGSQDLCHSMGDEQGAEQLAQHQEEQSHAQRIFRYLLDRGGKADLQAIQPLNDSFTSVADVFHKAFESERANSKAIHELYELARNCNDYATIAALQWFLDEQVEEEKLMSEAVGLLEFAGDDKSALLALNAQFGQRQPNTSAGE